MKTIHQKMTLIGVAVFILAGGGAGAGLWAADKLSQNVEAVTQDAQSLRNHMQADMMHDALRADVLASLLARDPVAGIKINDVAADLAEHVATFESAIKANQALVTDPKTRDILQQLDEPLARYIQAAQELVGQASSDPQKALLSLPKFMTQFSTLEGAMETAGDSIQAASADIKAHSDALSQRLALLLQALFGLAVIFSLAMVLATRHAITKPIKALSADMQQLASGDTGIMVKGAGRADEIGEMAGAVEVFRQAAIANQRLEQEAAAARGQAEADRIRVTAEAEAAAQATLREATSGLASGLRRLAAGDLAFVLEQPFAPDFEALRHDLNSAVTQLGETLLAVAQATNQIDNGTREISQSTNDLSRRTEQQAASLEETAAALDEITVNVSNSSKRAEEARAVAVQANISAKESGVVVTNAVDAMVRIEQSSHQISNIIGVIDEIAFQTNLLALNAGVEAARAGEAGKGFAVVAQEVRELAQRSAQAAKEIKGLIRNSSAEVESGVKLVSETGNALQGIEKHIVTINAHMEAIATAAREQSAGLAEVNTAVNQMDHVTQQNAAMVEESNAASATLAGEASHLRELIERFQLVRQTSRPTTELRRPVRERQMAMSA